MVAVKVLGKFQDLGISGFSSRLFRNLGVKGFGLPREPHTPVRNVA